MTTSESYLELARERLEAYRPQRIDPLGRPQAAVLLLLYDIDGRTHVLFTKRTELVEHHKGEICFPGGSQEEDDVDLYYTALRETFEEVGLMPEHVERVGQLDDIVSRVSNFVISPYVGFVTTATPMAFNHAVHEVDEVLEAPLAHLLDERNMSRETRRFEGEDVVIDIYRWRNHAIWGATARILTQFLGLLRG